MKEQVLSITVQPCFSVSIFQHPLHAHVRACAHVRCGGGDASVYVQVEAREEARAAVRELLLQREADALQARRQASLKLQVHLV